MSPASGFPYLMTGVHGAARKAFEAAGYRFERRRSGDLGLGLWRMRFRTPLPGVRPRRLVLIPGFGDTPLSWSGSLLLLQPVIRARFDEMICLDFPGFSGSLASETCFPSFDLLYEACADLLDDLKPESILGHSLGGWLAARYAVACGEGSRPKRGLVTAADGIAREDARGAGLSRDAASSAAPPELILISPSGVFGSEAERAEWSKVFLDSTSVGFAPIRQRLFDKEPFWFRWVAHDFADFTRREDIVAFLRSFNDDHCLDERVRSIRSRTWLIWGDRDRLVPWGWHRDWLRYLPSDSTREARAVLLKKIGHNPQLEAPARIAWVLSQILQQKEFSTQQGRWWSVVSPEHAEPASHLERE